MLLGDFKTYISSEINKDILYTRATLLPQNIENSLGEYEIEQLISVIYGLLRQNSYTFLEVLEEASIAAIKSTFRWELLLFLLGFFVKLMDICLQGGR